MAIDFLPASPSGQITHQEVREKINEAAQVSNTTVTELQTTAASLNNIDPQGKEVDSFKMENMEEGTIAKIFTNVERDKLALLNDSGYLGVFADLAALQSAHPTGTSGDFATVTAPSGNLFYWNVPPGEWADSGTGHYGDMQKSVYDPQGKNADAFAMANMLEGVDTKVMTAAERTKLAGLVNNVYGTERYVVNEKAFTLTTNDIDSPNASNTKLTITTGVLPTGIYQLKTAFLFRMEKDGRFRACVKQGGVELAECTKYKSDENSDVLAQSFTTPDLALLGVQTFDLCYGPDQGGWGAEMGEAVLELIRVG